MNIPWTLLLSYHPSFFFFNSIACSTACSCCLPNRCNHLSQRQPLRKEREGLTSMQAQRHCPCHAMPWHAKKGSQQHMTSGPILFRGNKLDFFCRIYDYIPYVFFCLCLCVCLVSIGTLWHMILVSWVVRCLHSPIFFPPCVLPSLRLLMLLLRLREKTKIRHR
jgi:hypothetical protein